MGIHSSLITSVNLGRLSPFLRSGAGKFLEYTPDGEELE